MSAHNGARISSESSQTFSAMSRPSDNEACVLDPVAAYDALAGSYHSLVESKSRYLRKIEDLVISHISGAQSLLDVGAGDGSRTLRIAESARITRVVLVEPSARMRSRCQQEVEYWPCRAAQIPENAPKFDVITCLWNVLGHLPNQEERVFVLSRLRSSLAPAGAIFLDVNHRYNVAAYGATRTLLRMAYDLAFPSEKNGDVIVSWRVGDRSIRTHGHVFTRGELNNLFCGSGLTIRKKWVVNYHSGERQKSPLFGNLLYQLVA
jgi:2-polyprenyl-3-methyl-5-hydroxy-6-metoxy-1,4-benzoquinol methylase